MSGRVPAGWAGAAARPAGAVTVPVAFATMVGVSLADRGALPAHVGRTMVRLHLPEALDVDRGSYRPSEDHAEGGPPARASAGT